MQRFRLPPWARPGVYLVEPLIWRFLPAEFLDLCRIEDNHVTAALLAQAALSLVLADAFATAVLALAALPPVLAEAAAAALLVLAGRPPVRTGHETHRARESSRISGSKQLAGFVKFASTPLKITRQRFEPTS